MGRKAYSDELTAALARADSGAMCEQIDAFAAHYRAEWPDQYADGFGAIISSPFKDPDKALAYVVLAAARSDDPSFHAMIGSGLLEDLLRDPSQEILDRIVAQARKSERFRCVLSHPFRTAISDEVWHAIKMFRAI